MDCWTVEVRSATKLQFPPGWTVLYFHVVGRKRRWEPHLSEMVPQLTVTELREIVDHAKEIPDRS